MRLNIKLPTTNSFIPRGASLIEGYSLFGDILLALPYPLHFPFGDYILFPHFLGLDEARQIRRMSSCRVTPNIVASSEAE